MSQPVHEIQVSIDSQCHVKRLSHAEMMQLLVPGERLATKSLPFELKEANDMSGVRNKTELLLLLLYASDGPTPSPSAAPIVGITRLEKLLFLAKLEQSFLHDAPYEQDFHFVPFKMGPWTQEVYDEVDFLESLGLLAKEQQGELSVEDEAHNDELFSDLVLDKYQKSSIALDETTDAFQLTS